MTLALALARHPLSEFSVPLLPNTLLTPVFYPITRKRVGTENSLKGRGKDSREIVTLVLI